MSNSSDFAVKDGVLKLKGEAKSVSTRVKGPVIHTTKGEPEERRKWMVKLARAIKAERDGARWVPEDRYAVTLQFRFHPRPQELDVDNYVKPVLDGLAAGLFLPEDTDPDDVWPFDSHHGVDDSNFRILLIHRLRDAKPPEEEGVRLFVSSSGNAPPG